MFLDGKMRYINQNYTKSGLKTVIARNIKENIDFLKILLIQKKIFQYYQRIKIKIQKYD